MSFFPTRPRAAAALAALTIPTSPAATWGEHLYGQATLDAEDVRDLLTALTCPVPCVGSVNDTGWHLGCDERAGAAMDVLGRQLSFLTGTRPAESRPVAVDAATRIESLVADAAQVDPDKALERLVEGLTRLVEDLRAPTAS